MRNLADTIAQVEATKINASADQFKEQLLQIQADAQSCENKISSWLNGQVKIESLESLNEYKSQWLINLPIMLENESKFNNMLLCLAWALQVEQIDQQYNS